MTLDEIKKQIFVDSEEVCGDTMIDTYSAQEYVEQAYNKAIDDFTEKLMEQQIYNCMLPDGFRTDIVTSNTIDAIAEQLKVGDGE